MATVTKGPSDARANLFGGTGTVQVWDLLGDVAAKPFSAVLSCELEAQGSVGAHLQQADPEIVVGLEGAGEASVNGKPQPLGAGDVVHLPLGATLAITNLGDEPLRYLIIKASVG